MAGNATACPALPPQAPVIMIPPVTMNARAIAATVGLGLGLTIPSWGTVNLAGEFDDEGTVVSSTRIAPGTAVSFRGLLSMQHDIGVARGMYVETDSITISQEGTRVVFLGADKKRRKVWEKSWRYGKTAIAGEKEMRLVFRASRVNGGEYLLVLSNVSDNRMVLVDAFRIDPTLYGPAQEPVGSFLFARR